MHVAFSPSLYKPDKSQTWQEGRPAYNDLTLQVMMSSQLDSMAVVCICTSVSPVTTERGKMMG